jgi:hypothetical protein
MATHRSGYEHEEKDFAHQDGVPSDMAKKSPNVLDLSKSGEPVPLYEGEEGLRRDSVVMETAEDLVTNVIGLDDDPTLNPWTFRAFFLGMSNNASFMGYIELPALVLQLQ